VSLELLDAHETDEGLAVTFGTEWGIERLVGSVQEVAHLARVMTQVAALGQAGEHERVWIEAVPVGDAVVQLGLSPGGQTRVQITRRG
jgi:uncharacterized protein YqfA (UPF0365 family)